jgi:ribonuclease HI
MGVGAVGYLVNGDGARVFELSEPHGPGTNNLAEYIAIRRTLEKALEQGVAGVDIECDSLVVVRQIKGENCCRQPHLADERLKIICLVSQFEDGVTFKHIYDDYNHQADRLARNAARRRS